MNSTILDVLVDESIRSEPALQQHVIEQASAGTPWLIEE